MPQAFARLLVPRAWQRGAESRLPEENTRAAKGPCEADQRVMASGNGRRFAAKTPARRVRRTARPPLWRSGARG